MFVEVTLAAHCGDEGILWLLMLDLWSRRPKVPVKLVSNQRLWRPWCGTVWKVIKNSILCEVPFSQILSQMGKWDVLDQNDPFRMHFPGPNHNFLKWSWAGASHFGSLFGCPSI